MNNHFQISLQPSNCGLCEAETAYPIESRDRGGKPLTVVVCSHCGVVHNDPIPTAAELSHFYTENYRTAYKGTREPKLRHAARYFPAVAGHIRAHWHHYQHADHVLDIGRGSGEFLYLMRELGKATAGLEPTRDYANFCRVRLGLEVTTGEIDSFAPSRQYDHIRLCHVVEHLRDPVANLRSISKWLTETGTLYVEVPDFKQYCQTKTPGKLFHYGHIYNFDHDTFEFMIGLAGLEMVERVGPTAAFLRRTSEPIHFTPAKAWPIQDKIAFYQRQRSRNLSILKRLSKCISKATKMFREQKTIASNPDHVSLANEAAYSLKHLISR